MTNILSCKHQLIIHNEGNLDRKGGLCVCLPPLCSVPCYVQEGFPWNGPEQPLDLLFP